MRLPWLKIITCFSFWTLANLAMSWSMKTKSLGRHPETGVSYANFMKHIHSYLDVAKVGVLLVHKLEECALSCVTYYNCFSFNVATKPSDARGHILCELLGTDKYNRPSHFKTNPNFHHYSIATLCSKNPCKNGGTCLPKYEEDGYNCVCLRGFSGEHCQKGIDLEKSDIIGNTYKHLKQLEEWLLPVKNASTIWHRCFHGMTDGFTASDFHSYCDDKGPTVTIVRVGSYIFGGYTDQSWSSSGVCKQKGSSASFLFTLSNKNGIPEKLGLRSSYDATAIYTCGNLGPSFGNFGLALYITNTPHTNAGSFTYSNTYQNPKGCSFKAKCTAFAGSFQSWKVSDIEVFYEFI